MQLLFEKNPNSKAFEKKKNSIIVDHQLKELDFIICKQNEVILTNIEREIDLDKLTNLIKGNKKSKINTNNQRIKKTKELSKDDYIKPSSENNVENSKNENVLSTKRKSYRQKVKDFKSNKLKPENSAKIIKNNENLEVIKKQENQEKRQGWWNQ